MTKMIELGRATEETKSDFILGQVADGAGALVCQSGAVYPLTADPGQPRPDPSQC